MEFTEYDSISDQVLFFDDNITLAFVVMMARKTKTGERIFNQYETVSTDKYGSPQRSIKRNLNYFFAIRNKNNFGNSIVLRPQDVEMLKMLIPTKILPWFIGDNQAFKIKKLEDGQDQLILGTVEQVPMYLDNGKFMTFEPILVFEEDKAGRGVRMYLSTGETIDMPVNTFMHFYNILQTDMYAVAVANWAYVKTQPYGVNIYNSKGLGAAPAKLVNQIGIPEKSFGNSFLNNVKSKRKEE